jgi:hypothetical protein
MSGEHERRGREVAALFFEHAPALFAMMTAAADWPSALRSGEAHDRARAEWDAFALYACVRGLVAGGGMNRETAEALDAFHDAMLAAPGEPSGAPVPDRSLLSERYREYGEIGQAGGKAGSATVTQRLGLAAARHMLAEATADEVTLASLAEQVGELHETLAEVIAARVRGES